MPTYACGSRPIRRIPWSWVATPTLTLQATRRRGALPEAFLRVRTAGSRPPSQPSSQEQRMPAALSEHHLLAGLLKIVHVYAVSPCVGDPGKNHADPGSHERGSLVALLHGVNYMQIASHSAYLSLKIGMPKFG
eukprot:41056-Chlamydomonas_euryale.AAC.1